MNKTLKTILWIVVVLIVLGVIWRYSTRDNSLSQIDKIKIGVVAPMTGDAAFGGTMYKNASQLAVDQINAKGGVKGKQIELIFEDSKCNGEDAASAAQKLVNIDKVNFILGDACSSGAVAMTPITEQAKVMQFSSVASSPKLSGISKYFVRNVDSDSAPARTLALHVVKNHQKLAIISENSDYPQGLREVFKQTVADNGGNLVADEVFNSDNKDFRTILLKVGKEKPDAIFINPVDHVSFLTLLKQIKTTDLKDVQIYGYWIPGTESFLQGGAEYTEGIIFYDVPGLNSENPVTAQFLADYQTKYDKLPDSDFVEGGIYDSVYILKQAVEEVGMNPEKISDYLRGLSGYNGVLGTYGINEKGDLTGIDYVLKKIENGKPVVIGQ